MTLNNWINNLSKTELDNIKDDSNSRYSNLNGYHESYNNPAERIFFHGDNRKIPVSIKEKIDKDSYLMENTNNPVNGLTSFEWEYLDKSLYRNNILLKSFGIIELFNKGKVTIWVKETINPGDSLPYLVNIDLDNFFEMELTGWIDITSELSYKNVWAIGKRIKMECFTKDDVLYYLPWPCNYLYKTVTGKYRIY